MTTPRRAFEESYRVLRNRGGGIYEQLTPLEKLMGKEDIKGLMGRNPALYPFYYLLSVLLRICTWLVLLHLYLITLHLFLLRTFWQFTGFIVFPESFQP